MTTKKQSQEEEIELGSLFVLIGKGFSAILKAVQQLLTYFFHVLITFLLFVKKHVIKLSLAALLGGVLGGFLETNKTQKFGADLLVQPNFKSTKQLYNNVGYYAALIQQKDTFLLAKTFAISVEEAASIKKFEIKPVKNSSDLLASYDEFLNSVDSLSVKKYTFSMFEKSFTTTDYKQHTIHVAATKNKVFQKLENVIIAEVVANKHFEKAKQLTNENLHRTNTSLQENLAQVDSLRKMYLQTMLAESKKVTTGTSIAFGGDKNTFKEIELFETSREINEELKEVSTALSQNTAVVNVLSSFQPVGYEINGFKENLAVLGAGVGLGLVFLFLGLLQLNSYLDTYKK